MTTAPDEKSLQRMKAAESQLANLRKVFESTPVFIPTDGVIAGPALLNYKKAAEAAGVPLTVFQNRRWDSEQLTLRAVLASGALGEVHRFERRWERWRPVPKDRWKENDLVGGGLLLDLGAHLVDSAVQLFGPPAHVYAELRSVTTVTEDEVFLALEHAGGVTSHLQASGIAGAPGPRTRVLGTRGAYVVTEFEGEPASFTLDVPAADDVAEGSDQEGWIVRGSTATPVRRAPGGHEDFYRAVRAWVLDGGPVPVLRCEPGDSLELPAAIAALALLARASAWQSQTDAAA